MNVPQFELSPVPKGPLDDVHGRLLGQFWIKLALRATDLPDGPSVPRPPTPAPGESP